MDQIKQITYQHFGFGAAAIGRCKRSQRIWRITSQRSGQDSLRFAPPGPAKHIRNHIIGQFICSHRGRLIKQGQRITNRTFGRPCNRG